MYSIEKIIRDRCRAACNGRSHLAELPLRIKALIPAQVYWFVIVMILTLPQASMGADFTVRVWLNDAKAFQAYVLEPLDAHFGDQECINNTDVYLGALFIKMRELKGTVHTKSYFLLRAAVLMTAGDVVPFENIINCSIIDRWQLVVNHLQNEIELIGDVIFLVKE